MRKVGAEMVLAEFSIWPMDKGESVGAYVAAALDVVDRSGLPYRLGPMGTCLEGSWEEVMSVIRQCYEKMAEDCGRITCSIKLDYRQGHAGRLEAKVQAVEKRVGRKLRT